ncbi:MAG: glycosyltransferase, partial [Acidimicrobiales bacterium]
MRGAGPVALDLIGALGAGYRDRGVARYSEEVTAALLARHGDMIGSVIYDPAGPRPRHEAELLASGKPVPADGWDPGDQEVLHLMSPYALDLPVARLWPRRSAGRGMRLVVTVYDLIPEVMPDVYLADPGLRARYRARHDLVRSADALVTLSQSSAADVVEMLGIPEHKVHVVGAGCDSAFHPPASRSDAAVAASGLVPALGTRYVAYNGAVEPRKNMERLVEAYAALPAHLRAEWQLLLVCRMAPLERNHYEVLARRLGIEGRLVLGGYLADEALVIVYQGAGLVVFPSLYEGYGLPVVEARSCGAPVMASDTSALRELVPAEARFDPTSTSSIAAALQRGLSDPEMRARLAPQPGEVPPTWGEVADRTAAAYRGLLGKPGPRRRRPKLAVITPWPPAATGVAIYSARLFEHLVPYADVEVYGDGPTPGELSAVGFPRASAVHAGYDAVVACVGNSEHHTSALRLLRHGDLGRPIVFAHDVRLTGLYHHAAGSGYLDFAQTAAAMYPELATSLSPGPRTVAPQEALSREVMDRRGLLMAREVVGLSGTFLVTSDTAADLARTDAVAQDAERIATLPYAYPDRGPARDRRREEPGLIVSFGLLNRAKCPDLLVDALAIVAVERPDVRLVMVGPGSEEDAAHLHAMAAT